ncbi:MAG TPA: ABC transporter ATP-binding protein [Roseiflexaceae bacterium]|nr:ABC transporter ATP-binding protein [Roseiflexaceae bacterium]
MNSPNTPAALIAVDHLSFTYRRAREPALADVSLDVRPGELLLIAGPSGCGKSTLLRCLNGLIPSTYRGDMQGDVRVAGRDTRDMTLAEISRTVGNVLQDPERQIVASHVLEEVAFGLENLGLPVGEVLRRAEATLDELHMLHLAKRETFTLSGGEKQKLAAAGVLALEPRVLLLDEPLANLDPASAAEALALFRRLADSGRAVVIVEHRVEEVLSLNPERVMLMDQGRIIYSGPAGDVGAFADPRAVKLPAPIAIQRLAALDDERQTTNDERSAEQALHPSPASPPLDPKRQTGETPLVELRDVEFGYGETPVLHGVSLQVNPGDRIALLGPNGSGKSTLVKHMIGLLRPQRGAVFIGGAPAEKLSVAQAARQVGYVFQSPSHMLFAPTVREELAFGPRNVGQSADEIARHSAEALALVGLEGYDERPPLTLSFGQQRRLCIASVIAMRAQVLLMDEPTAGQDYRSYTQFMDGILELGVFAAQIFITHDVDLAISYANRVLLFADGRIVADGPPHDVLARTDLLDRCRLRPTSLLYENLRLLPQTGSFQRLEALAALASSHAASR